MIKVNIGKNVILQFPLETWETETCGHDDHRVETGNSLNVSRVNEAGKPICEDRSSQLY